MHKNSQLYVHSYKKFCIKSDYSVEIVGIGLRLGAFENTVRRRSGNHVENGQ